MQCNFRSIIIVSGFLGLLVACDVKKVDTSEIKDEVENRKPLVTTANQRYTTAFTVGQMCLDSLEKCWETDLTTQLSEDSARAALLCPLEKNALKANMQQDLEVIINKYSTAYRADSARMQQALDIYPKNNEATGGRQLDQLIVLNQSKDYQLSRPLFIDENNCGGCHGVNSTIKDTTLVNLQKGQLAGYWIVKIPLTTVAKFIRAEQKK